MIDKLVVLSFQLYDLHVGNVSYSEGTVEDGCPREGCSVCSNNSVCVGSLSESPTCLCKPGFQGPDCLDGKECRIIT